MLDMKYKKSYTASQHKYKKTVICVYEGGYAGPRDQALRVGAKVWRDRNV